MKRVIVLFVVLSPIFAAAQSDSSHLSADSIRYYQRTIGQLQRKLMDSLMNSPEYKDMTNRLVHWKKKSRNYSAPVFFVDLFHTNFDNLDATITQKGFDRMTELAFRVGFGVSSKSNRLIYDIYFITAGMKHETKKAAESISFSASNALQFDWGYDLLNAKRFSLYPYAGLSLRFTNMKYSKPTQFNPAITDISDLVLNDQSVEVNATRLGYQLGMGFDYWLTKETTSANLLFVKFGMNRPVGRDRYKIEGVRYDPRIKAGDWLVSVGVKFGLRE